MPVVTVRESLKRDIDALPEESLAAVRDFLMFQWYKIEKQSDTEYLSSIPGMMDSIREAPRRRTLNASRWKKCGLMYRLEFTRQAQKDAVLIERAGLKPKALELLNIIKSNPYQTPPRYEKLQGVTDTYSRRINIQHRIVCRVFAGEILSA